MSPYPGGSAHGEELTVCLHDASSGRHSGWVTPSQSCSEAALRDGQCASRSCLVVAGRMSLSLPLAKRTQWSTLAKTYHLYGTSPDPYAQPECTSHLQSAAPSCDTLVGSLERARTGTRSPCASVVLQMRNRQQSSFVRREARKEKKRKEKKRKKNLSARSLLAVERLSICVRKRYTTASWRRQQGHPQHRAVSQLWWYQR